jgi:ParB family chromosome partitioning protein
MEESVFKEILVDLVDPSPFQHRRTFLKLRELGESIARDGLVQPITVRTKENRFELIAGERRFRAAKEHAGLSKIMARIVYVDDHAARRMCATENMQRDDLSAIEEVEAKVEILDAEFGDDAEYMALGDMAGDRVRGLLGRMQTCFAHDDGELSESAKQFGHKFMSKVLAVFSGLPKPVEWRSFYNNDLGITAIPENIKQWAATNKLNKSQTKELAKLAKADPQKFEEIVSSADDDGLITVTRDDGESVPLQEVSAREIKQSTQAPLKQVDSTGSFHISTGENDWYTPEDYIDAARAVLGDIDLDPATSEVAQTIVKAKQYFTKETDGLSKHWSGRVWMNPPYSMPDIQCFVEKIVDEFTSGKVSEAIVLTNNSSDTRWFHALLNSSGIACLPTSRVKFYNPDSEVMATRQGQTLFYFGENKAKFSEVFSSFGAIVEKR